MSIIDPNTFLYNPQPVELSSLMREIENIATNKLQPGVMLNCVLGAPMCVIRTDSAGIKAVMEQFMDNASKFTSHGSVTFGYEDRFDDIYFFVRDTGIGLSHEAISSLLEPSNPLTAGHGLIAAKEIIEKMGGSLTINSRGLGKGAQFAFSIPYVEAELPVEALPLVNHQRNITLDPPVETMTPPKPVEESTDNRPLILVAEDNGPNYLLFRSILEKKYRLLHANNGAEAIDLFKQHNPDLIVMDINMPVVDGYQATAEIRKLSESVPIIAVTAYAFVTDRQRILENGFNTYVSKPINVKRFEATIAGFLAD